jgi:hypothetical protein
MSTRYFKIRLKHLVFIKIKEKLFCYSLFNFSFANLRNHFNFAKLRKINNNNINKGGGGFPSAPMKQVMRTATNNSFKNAAIE